MARSSETPPVARSKKPKSKPAILPCAWPKRDVEGLRAKLDAARDYWPEIAKASCLGERYLRAFVSGQIYCPPYDRFVLIQSALGALVVKPR